MVNNRKDTIVDTDNKHQSDGWFGSILAESDISGSWFLVYMPVRNVLQADDPAAFDTAC